MSTRSTTKILPQIPSKKEIYKLFGYKNVNYIKKQINTILEASGESKRKQIINNNQFKELLSIIGTPKGYEPLE